MDIDGSGQRFFCHERTLFKSSADADADDHRRAGVGTCIFYSGENRIFDALDAVGRFEHKDAAHVLTAKAFGCDSNRHLIAQGQFIMNDSRGIVLGIFAQKRVFDNGLDRKSVV